MKKFINSFLNKFIIKNMNNQNNPKFSWTDGLGYIKNKDRLVISTEDFKVFDSYRKQNQDKKIVCTHSGVFHADEVLATVMTKYIKEFENSWIIRTRNYDIHKETDLICDVGGIFDPTTNRFDHHMKEFTHNFDDILKIKMSSAGLIYKYHGREIIENILKAMNAYDENKEVLEKIYNKIYVNFIAYVDAHDNGINQYPEEASPRYMNNTSYSSRVSRLNPEWYEPNADQSERFKLAQDVAEEEFICQIKYVAKSYFPAYSIVKDAVNKRFNVHDSGRIIVLGKSIPWKELLYTIEDEDGIKDQVQFAIFKNSETDYRVQTVPLSQGNFKFRKGLPENWRGVEKEKLAGISGIHDIVFVHSSGFIGGAKSYESAMKMAVEALK
jgi:uncharacterized UPF0160 family protein